LRAGSPLGPGRKLAINRAGESVAALGSRERCASDATMEGRSEDGLGVGLGTGGTSPGARSPGRPIGELAVNGAGEGAATEGYGHGAGAHYTTMGSLSNDGTGLDLGASPTGLGAGRIPRPARKLAVNGAGESVALDSFGGGVVAEAAVLSAEDYLARHNLGSSGAAGSSASAVQNVGDSAIDWLGGGVRSWCRGDNVVDISGVRDLATERQKSGLQIFADELAETEVVADTVDALDDDNNLHFGDGSIAEESPDHLLSFAAIVHVSFCDRNLF
jgi:hypothetical protein